MQIKVDQAADAPLMLGMQCGENCDGQFDISKQVKAASDWQTLTIDLSCFAEQGVQLGQVFSPWQLATEGAWQVSIAKLNVTTSKKNDTAISCN
jgi:beta-glucosidase